jgi:hypothetical protein
MSKRGDVDVKVQGAEEFGTLARHLKQAGDKELRKELYAAINRKAKPLADGVRASLGQYMPNRYAAELAPSLRIATSKLAGRNPAVRLKAQAKTRRGKPRELARLDQGVLRHPLHGNRRHWYNQPVRAGFYTGELEQGAPKVRQELVEAIQAVARKIEAGI